MKKIETDEELNELPAGSVVFYSVFYDGMNHLLAEKFNDGDWYAGDNVDGFDNIEPSTPC